MTKLLTILLLSFCLSACQSTRPDRSIAFQYSAYSFYDNHEKEAVEFYLAYYLKIDEKGNYKVLRHTTFMDSPKYFEGKLDEEFKQALDSMIIQINNTMPITIADTPSLVYDGFSYCLDYKIGENRNCIPNYINAKERSPENILSLTTKLDQFLCNLRKTEIDSFSLANYIDTLKQKSSIGKVMPAKKAPAIQENQIKFAPPKLKR